MDTTTEMRVMTINRHGVRTADPFVQIVNESHPAIICVQEVNHLRNELESTSTLHELASAATEATGEAHAAFFKETRRTSRKVYGIGIIVNTARVRIHARAAIKLTPGDHPTCAAGKMIPRCAVGALVSPIGMDDGEDHAVWVVSAHLGYFKTRTDVVGPLGQIANAFGDNVILGADVNAEPSVLNACPLTTWLGPGAGALDVPVGLRNGLARNLVPTFRPSRKEDGTRAADRRLDYVLVTAGSRWVGGAEDVGDLIDWEDVPGTSDHAHVTVTFTLNK